MKLLILLFLVLSCSDSGKDVQDLYDEQVILAKLLEPTPKPQEKCEEMLTKAGECITLATDKNDQYLQSLGTESYTVIANIPGFVVDPTKLNDIGYISGIKSISTRANYCSTALASSALRTASDAYKDCLYSCQTENYTSFLNAGTCTSSLTQTLVVESNGTGQNFCAIKCGKVTNN